MSHILKSAISSASFKPLDPTEPAPAALLRLAIKVAGHFSHSWSALDAWPNWHGPDAPQATSAIQGPLSMTQIQTLTFERDPDAWQSSISHPNLCRDTQGRYVYLHETMSSRYRVFIRQELDWSFSVIIEIPTLLPDGDEKIEAVGCAVKIRISPEGEVLATESFIPPHAEGCGEWAQPDDRRWLISPNGRKVQRTMPHHLRLAEEVVEIFVKGWSFPDAQKSVAESCDHAQRDFEAACPEGWAVENGFWKKDGVEIARDGWFGLADPIRGWVEHYADNPETALSYVNKALSFYKETEEWDILKDYWRINPEDGSLWALTASMDTPFCRQVNEDWEYLESM